VIVLRISPALGAGLDVDLGAPFQGARFLEATMSTLFHVRAPDYELERRHPSVPLLSPDGTPVQPSLAWEAMPEEFDVAAMIQRFRERATAVRNRGMPPVEGADRRRIMQQMQLDYMDFAMVGDAEGTIEDGFLVLRVDLRPPAAKG
jgi:hypothetical protein